MAACARPLSPEDTVQVQAVRVGVSRHPPPCAAWRGPEEGGGRRESARAGERPRARAAGERREEAAHGGARPRPGPSGASTSPCNFSAQGSAKVGPCQLSRRDQTGNGLASSLWLLLWARHSRSTGIQSLQAPSRRARQPGGGPLPASAAPPSWNPATGSRPPAAPKRPTPPPPRCRVPVPINTCRGSRHCPIVQTPLFSKRVSGRKGDGGSTEI